MNAWGGGGRELRGNFGTAVRTSFLKPTSIIYLVFEKNDLFIYLIEQNVTHLHIHILFFDFYTLFAIFKQSSQINITILVSELNILAKI